MEPINSYPKKAAKIVFVVKTKPKNNNRGIESNVNNYFFPESVMTQIRQRDNRSYNNNLSLADNKYNIHVNSAVCSMCMAIKEKVNLIIADFCEPIITNFLSLLPTTSPYHPCVNEGSKYEKRSGGSSLLD